MNTKTSTKEIISAHTGFSALDNTIPWVVYNKSTGYIHLNDRCRSLFENPENPTSFDLEGTEKEFLELFSEAYNTEEWKYGIVQAKEIIYLPTASFEIDNINGYNIYSILDVEATSDAFNETSIVKKIWDYHAAVLNAIDDGIFITDGEGNVISVNSRALFGRDPASMIGFNMRELAEKGICPESVSLEAIKIGQSVTKYQYRHKACEILTTATPYFKDGKINMVVCCQRPVNQLEILKKQLLEAEELNSQFQGELDYFRTLNLKEYDFVIESESMKKVLSLASIAAQYDSPVLLQGESGAGKEVIADYLYKNGPRYNKPFIKINCNAIPESLFESEFFGYDKGAFSGANVSGHQGYFELANHGVLLLDEIGDIPLNIQAKLLRAIERKEIVKMGGDKTISLDVQIIAATNKDLAEAVKNGTFRSDLYYRLTTFPIVVPSLRDRREDILPLIHFFTHQNNKKYGLNKKFSADALLVLEQHEWVGNVRELENTITRIILTVPSDEIESIHLLSILVGEVGLPEISSEAATFDDVIDNFEKMLLINYIKKYPSINDLEAALSMSRSTLNRKLLKYDLRKHMIDSF